MHLNMASGQPVSCRIAKKFASKYLWRYLLRLETKRLAFQAIDHVFKLKGFSRKIGHIPEEGICVTWGSLSGTVKVKLGSFNIGSGCKEAHVCNHFSPSVLRVPTGRVFPWVSCYVTHVHLFQVPCVLQTADEANLCLPWSIACIRNFNNLQLTYKISKPEHTLRMSNNRLYYYRGFGKQI